ncbi:MAG: SDR family oxidoreductase [Myxococcaceae bacterium]|nr:MAG: SDR family oxidoreductase [Myxococcaceae bacterium]
MKQALVTGASRGIGASVALSLAEAGFRIWLHYRSREDAARQVAATIVERGGPEPILVGFDLADRKVASDAVVALTDQHGAPDAFVLNAGITLNALFAMTSDREWDEVIATNLGGLLAVGRPVVKAMVRARTGRIVLVSSVASQIGNAGYVAYAASKGALNSAALSLARELAPRGITVNVVSPGLIETEMLQGAPVDKLLSAIPAGRLGRASEVAHVIRYLCSEESGCLTGQIVNVAGGL